MTETHPYKHIDTLRPSAAAAIHDKIDIYKDWPKPGVLFRDLMPACEDHEVFDYMIDAIAEALDDSWPTAVVGIETRGYIIGAALAQKIGAGFVRCAKAAARPWPTDRETYATEYSTATLEMRVGALKRGTRVVVLDDLLATGGSAGAAVALCRRQEATVVGVVVGVELAGLGGRIKLAARGVPVHALLTY